MKCLWAPWRMEYIAGEKKENCIFCIGAEDNNDSERLVIWREELAFVMLNRYPYTNGHLMVAPYRHTSDLGEISGEEARQIHDLLCLSRDALSRISAPDGFNVGLNLGKVAGAGVEDHLHYHIVPRWSGDTNFMPVFADVRVVPQHLDETYAMLTAAFRQLRQSAG